MASLIPPAPDALTASGGAGAINHPSGGTRNARVATDAAGLRRDDAPPAGAARGASAVFLRLGRARRVVLRGLCPAGAGGLDTVGLRLAVDPRFRLVAHRAVGRRVAWQS